MFHMKNITIWFRNSSGTKLIGRQYRYPGWGLFLEHEASLCSGEKSLYKQRIVSPVIRVLVALLAKLAEMWCCCLTLGRPWRAYR